MIIKLRKWWENSPTDVTEYEFKSLDEVRESPDAIWRTEEPSTDNFDCTDFHCTEVTVDGVEVDYNVDGKQCVIDLIVEYLERISK